MKKAGSVGQSPYGTRRCRDRSRSLRTDRRDYMSSSRESEFHYRSGNYESSRYGKDSKKYDSYGDKDLYRSRDNSKRSSRKDDD